MYDTASYIIKSQGAFIQTFLYIKGDLILHGGFYAKCTTFAVKSEKYW